MFRVVLREQAVRALRRMKAFHARQITNAMETHLRFEPERISRQTIKRLRGRQRAVFRLRVGEYRVFYDVLPEEVSVVAILNKSQTRSFYLPEESS